MKYEKIQQCSRQYKYGKKEEFLTREDAQNAINKLKQEIGTQLAILKLYELSEIKIIEVKNVFQLVVIIKIPKLL